MAKHSAYAALLGLVGGTLYLGRVWTQRRRRHTLLLAVDGMSSLRARKLAQATIELLQEPPFEKSLPDPIPEY